MSECRFALSLAQRDTGNEMVQVSMKNKIISESAEIGWKVIKLQS